MTRVIARPSQNLFLHDLSKKRIDVVKVTMNCQRSVLLHKNVMQIHHHSESSLSVNSRKTCFPHKYIFSLQAPFTILLAYSEDLTTGSP